LLQWFIEQTDTSLAGCTGAYKTRLLNEACKRSDGVLFRWLVATVAPAVPLDDPLLCACYFGSAAVVAQVFALQKVRHQTCLAAFRIACGRGHLRIARKLAVDFCAFTVADIASDSNHAAGVAAQRSHFHIVDWLTDTYGIAQTDRYIRFEPIVYHGLDVSVGPAGGAGNDDTDAESIIGDTGSEAAGFDERAGLSMADFTDAKIAGRIDGRPLPAAALPRGNSALANIRRAAVDDELNSGDELGGDDDDELGGDDDDELSGGDELSGDELGGVAAPGGVPRRDAAGPARSILDI
jgi:hypothetical protein